MYGIPEFEDLKVTCTFSMACDGSGKFDVDLDIELGSSSTFSCMGNDFEVANIDIDVSRKDKNSPFRVNITGSLSGIDNLKATMAFDLPWDGNMEVKASFLSPDASVLSNNPPMQVWHMNFFFEKWQFLTYFNRFHLLVP